MIHIIISLYPFLGKLQLNVSLTISSIYDINKERTSMRIETILKVSWIDANAEMFNLNNDYKLNMLTLDQKKSIWLPSFVFNDTRRYSEATFDDKSSVGYILLNKNSRHTLPGLDALINYKKYKGTDA